MSDRKRMSLVEQERGINGSVDPVDSADSVDPLDAFLDAAPYDDEPLTDEERAAEEAGWAAYLRGESDPLEVVRRRLLGESDVAQPAAR